MQPSPASRGKAVAASPAAEPLDLLLQPSLHLLLNIIIDLQMYRQVAITSNMEFGA